MHQIASMYSRVGNLLDQKYTKIDVHKQHTDCSLQELIRCVSQLDSCFIRKMPPIPDQNEFRNTYKILDGVAGIARVNKKIMILFVYPFSWH